MRASTIVALSFTSLVLVSSAASAEEKAKPAAHIPAAAAQAEPGMAKKIAQGLFELPDTVVHGRHPLTRPTAYIDAPVAASTAPCMR